MKAKSVVCTERLYLSKDRKAVVLEGDKRAATLYATPGHKIPGTAVEKFGLENGTLSGKARTASIAKGGRDGTKEKAPAGDKEMPAGGNKDGQNTPPKPPQLTDIAGIGPATAKALVDGEIADVAALAAVDPAAAPEIANLPPAFDWAAVVGSAKTLVAAQPAG